MADRNIEKKILKGGETRYYVRLTINGKRESQGGYRTLHLARAALREVERKVAEGTYGKEEEEPGLTLREWYEDWIAAKALSAKPATLIDYKYTVAQYVLPTLGDKPLNEITPDDVQDWILGLSDKGLGNATVNKAYRYFRNVINSAVAKEKLDRSPCREIDVPSASGETELDFLSLVEVARAIEVAAEPEKTLVGVLVYAGLRIGEALGLKWKDIDFGQHCIRVERTWTKHNAWSTPKSKSSHRAVPMTATLAAMLADLYDDTGKPSPDTVIFSADGKRPFSQSNTRKRFKKILDRAEIRHVRIHDCRHTFATQMLACGCSIKALQHALGHSSAVMTLDVYSHYVPEDAAEAVDRFEALILSTKKGDS